MSVGNTNYKMLVGFNMFTDRVMMGPSYNRDLALDPMEFSIDFDLVCQAICILHVAEFMAFINLLVLANKITGFYLANT